MPASLRVEAALAVPLAVADTLVGDIHGLPFLFEELLDLFDREGVDAAFWFTFAGYELPHRPPPRPRLASYRLVAVLGQGHGTGYPDMPWEPKRLFDTPAARYAGSGSPSSVV